MTDTPKSSSLPPRPLSPHLQVYRLPMTALMSISHRISGVILAGGCLLVMGFLYAAAAGEEYYNMIMGYVQTPWGGLLMIAWAFVLYYHLFNGIRHLIWDTVHLITLEKAEKAGWVVLIATIGLTAATWYYAGGMAWLQ